MARRAAGEGTIVKRKDGRWMGALTTGRKNGEQVRRLVYGKTQKEVQEKLTKLRAAQQSGFRIDADRQTVSDFLEYWIKNYVEKDCRENTKISYRQLIKNHINPNIGNVRLQKLSAQDVKVFMNDLSDSDSELSARTIQYIHAILRAALAEAVRLEVVPRNVATLVRPPRQEAKAVEPFSPEECVRLLNAAKDDRLGAMFSVAIALGLREGECFGLRWADVDLDGAKLNVRYQMQRVDGEMKFVPPKTAKSRRSLPLPDALLADLLNHKARQDDERELCGSKWQEHDLVFCTRIGTPLDAPNVLKRFHRLLEQAGLPKRRIHDLRHSCASLLVGKGVPLKTISDILGHSQISLTANLYSHLSLEVKREALDTMNDVLRPEVVKQVVKPGSPLVN